MKTLFTIMMLTTFSVNAGWFGNDIEGAFGIEFGDKTTKVSERNKIAMFDWYRVKTTAKSGKVYKIKAGKSGKYICYNIELINLRYALIEKYGKDESSSNNYHGYEKNTDDGRIYLECSDTFGYSIGYKNFEMKKLDKKERASNLNRSLI